MWYFGNELLVIDHMINYVGVAIKVNEVYLLSKFG